MKQFVSSFLLVVVAFVVAPNAAFAQCVPLDSIPGDGLIDPLPYTEDMPENGIRDTACVGEDYVTVFNIEVPETVSIPPFGAIAIDSIVLTGTSDLPQGLAYSLSSEDGVFIPNTTGCIQISGVPAEGTEGMYTLGINVTIFSGFFSSDFTLPDETIVPGEYRLFVRENGNAACQPSAIRERQGAGYVLNVFPNPANEVVNVEYTAKEAGQSQIILVDAFGRRVRAFNTFTSVGDNMLTVETGDLAAGFYTLLIARANSNMNDAVSSRVLINR